MRLCPSSSFPIHRRLQHSSRILHQYASVPAFRIFAFSISHCMSPSHCTLFLTCLNRAIPPFKHRFGVSCMIIWSGNAVSLIGAGKRNGRYDQRCG